MSQSRRAFLKTMTIGATAVFIVPWPPEEALADPVQPSSPAGWGPVAGRARYRIDGLAKVTGQKIYARDFHPRDIPGWPATARYAFLLRAVHADRPFAGLALDLLPADLQPRVVVTQTELDAAKITTPFADQPSTLFVELNAVPLYLGQPVALLLFDDLDTWRAATRLMQFEEKYVRYGAVTKPVVVPPYNPTSYLIRYSENGKELFSQVLAMSHVDPTSNKTKPDCEGKEVQDRIRALLASAPSHGWRTFQSETTTQAIDPMFMEPQAGMALMRTVDGKRTLEILTGTQSPNGDAATLTDILGGSPYNPSVIRILSCYPGGGFGGRDTSLFPNFLAIAACFSEGNVVRLEYDRFAEFQGGIKRNGSNIKQTFAVDATGRLQIVQSSMVLVGGGKQNYTPYVAELAAICGSGAYAVPMNDIYAEGQHTIGPTAGSMRGFGGPQAFFAVEHLMDEIASTLKIDPIELRLRNVLAEGGNTVTGAPITEPLALREICERARANPLWRDHEKERKRRAGGATAYGVGFALANQAYGTGTDGVLGRVEIDRDGNVLVTTNAVDMGNGSATSLAITPARWLGANASSIEMGDATFSNILNLTSTPGQTPCASPAPRVQELLRTRGLHAHRFTEEDEASTAEAPAQPCAPIPPSPNPWLANPCYTASISMSSSACITAFQQTHIIEQCSRVLFVGGIWPAALSLWRTNANPDSARWENGALVASGLAPLPLRALAAEAHRLRLTTGATAHALYQGQWASADWTIRNTTYKQWPIDALALRDGDGAYTRLVRQNVTSPPPQARYYGRSLYAPSGTLAAVEIEKRTGALRLVDVITYVDAGRPIQRQLLEGQHEGAVAMGFGYTFLEHMPQTIGGAGEGTWNLNRYGMALARDLPQLARMQLVTLREDSHPKGIAEAVLCPIAPALANAAAHATGRFYRSLPITMEQLREALA